MSAAPAPGVTGAVGLLQDFPPAPDDLPAWLRLSHTDGIGPVRGRMLLQRFGPPEAVLAAGFSAVAETLQSRTHAAALFNRAPQRDARVASAMQWLAGTPADMEPVEIEPGHLPPHILPHGYPRTIPRAVQRAILVLGDPLYPQRLLDLADPPLLLYCLGDPRWLSAPQVGIVGSRNATAIGTTTARAMAHHLATAGWTVVSGLAKGIDCAAHVGALAAGTCQENAAVPAGSTVAVLGTGIDRIYPSRHRALAQDIGRLGALVTEQPIGMLPLPVNFPRRNRLIAALSHAIMVAEATPQSGSLITAGLAAELGREVLAVPGSIHSPLARGCNSLIRQGAALVETAEDILAELPPISRLGLRWPFRAGSRIPPVPADGRRSAPGPASGAANPQGSSAPGQPLPKVQVRMLRAMSADPVMLETLADWQCLPLPDALAALQTLELAGLVQRQLDGSYIRC